MNKSVFSGIRNLADQIATGLSKVSERYTYCPTANHLSAMVKVASSIVCLLILQISSCVTIVLVANVFLTPFLYVKGTVQVSPRKMKFSLTRIWKNSFCLLSHISLSNVPPFWYGVGRLKVILIHLVSTI